MRWAARVAELWDSVTAQENTLILGAVRSVAASPEELRGLLDAVPDTAPRSKLLTPDGTATVLDNADSGDGREFFTFTTPAQNVFYLVIDKQRQDKNVYFLNAVTEKDLMSLAQTDGGVVETTPAPETQKETVCTCRDKCVPRGQRGLSGLRPVVEELQRRRARP